MKERFEKSRINYCHCFLSSKHPDANIPNKGTQVLSVLQFDRIWRCFEYALSGYRLM
jgi:hypothetical protein